LIRTRPVEELDPTMIAHCIFGLLPRTATDIVIQQPTEPWLPILAAVGVVVAVGIAVRRRRVPRGEDDGA
jgi:hypothetical protein